MSDLVRNTPPKPPEEKTRAAASSAAPPRPADAPPGERAADDPPAPEAAAGAPPPPVRSGDLRPPRLPRLSFRALATMAPAAAAGSVAAAEPQEAPVLDEPRAEARPETLFHELVRFEERVRTLVGRADTLPWAELDRLIERLVAALADSPDLFWTANSPTPPAGADPLAFHHARVSVLAVRIAANAGYEGRRLVELGIAACLIDVAFWAAGDGARRVDPASPEYRAHPRASAEIVRRWAPPSEAIVDAVLDHHELENGQGFPRGVRRDEIHPYAKVLGLVDRYASLTGSGVTRTRLRAHDVIREIVRSKNEAFGPSLIKALLGEISIFPPGTPVRLNTGEVARVVGVNRHHPLRPRIEVRADAKGHPLATPRSIDLAETPFLYITGPVAEQR